MIPGRCWCGAIGTVVDDARHGGFTTCGIERPQAFGHPPSSRRRDPEELHLGDRLRLPAPAASPITHLLARLQAQRSPSHPSPYLLPIFVRFVHPPPPP